LGLFSPVFAPQKQAKRGPKRRLISASGRKWALLGPPGGVPPFRLFFHRNQLFSAKTVDFDGILAQKGGHPPGRAQDLPFRTLVPGFSAGIFKNPESLRREEFVSLSRRSRGIGPVFYTNRGPKGRKKKKKKAEIYPPRLSGFSKKRHDLQKCAFSRGKPCLSAAKPP